MALHLAQKCFESSNLSFLVATSVCLMVLLFFSFGESSSLGVSRMVPGMLTPSFLRLSLSGLGQLMSFDLPTISHSAAWRSEGRVPQVDFLETSQRMVTENGGRILIPTNEAWKVSIPRLVSSVRCQEWKQKSWLISPLLSSNFLAVFPNSTHT